MIVATEAKTQTQKKINEEMTEELSKIESQIYKAISEKKFSFTANGILSPATKKRLVDAGYEVTTGSQRNGSFYTVSWS